jgi:hypothetical protein
MRPVDDEKGKRVKMIKKKKCFVMMSCQIIINLVVLYIVHTLKIISVSSGSFYLCVPFELMILYSCLVTISQIEEILFDDKFGG